MLARTRSPGEAEVDDAHASVAGEHHVGGLEIAVDHAALVRVVDRLGGLQHDAETDRHPRSLGELAEAAALRELAGTRLCSPAACEERSYQRAAVERAGIAASEHVQERIEADAIDPLHREEGQLALFADDVDGHDARMLSRATASPSRRKRSREPAKEE
jgi:hypothetical protein